MPAKPAPITTASTSPVTVPVVIARLPPCLVCWCLVWTWFACRGGRSADADGATLAVGHGARLHRLDHVLETPLAAGQEQDREEAVRLTLVAPGVHGHARL